MRPTPDETFDVAAIKKIAPPMRGHGKGRGADYSYDEAAMDRLIRFILTNHRIADTALAMTSDLDLPNARIQRSGADTNDVSAKFRRMRAYGVDAAVRRLALFKARRAEAPSNDRLATVALKESIAALPDETQIALMEQNLATWLKAARPKAKTRAGTE